MGHFGAEYELSVEDYLNPFAPQTSRDAGPMPALSREDGPFVSVLLTEMPPSTEAGELASGRDPERGDSDDIPTASSTDRGVAAEQDDLASNLLPSNKVLEVWEPKQKYGRTLYEEKTLTAPDRDELIAIEVPAWRFPGRTPSVALVFAGVHGTERNGVKVVNQLKQQLIKAAERGRLPEYTTVLIPELITARRWKDPVNPDPDDVRYVNVDGHRVEPNRNFPSPGESYAVARQRGLSRPDKAELLGRDERPLSGDKVTRRMLAETRILIRLIEEENPVRAVSAHAHSVPGKRHAGPGIFVDPRPWPPKASADISLATAMVEDAMRSLGATAGRKLDLRGTSGQQLSHPFQGNFADDATKKIPETPMLTVTYKSEHPPGTSFGEWAPARGIATITSELPRWQNVSSIVMNKLVNAHENAILRVFLGGLKAPGQTEPNGESLEAESWPSTSRDAGPMPAPFWEDGPFVSAEVTGMHPATEVGAVAHEEALGEETDNEDSEAEVLEEEALRGETDDESGGMALEFASPASTFESIAGEVLDGVLGHVSELGGLSEEMERAGRQFESAPATEADIADLFDLGKRIGRLGQGVGAALSVSPPSPAADVSVAVPEFNLLTRLSIKLPLLDAAANAKAVQWNGQHHPATSGVDPRNIRTDVARYVNLTAIATAIHNFNAANPTKAIQLGTPPIDAVLVEGIHQFQKRCFFETGQIDGMAGESTLDSVGLVKRSGMNSVDRRNTEAQRRLGSVDVAVALARTEFTADTWFDHMVNPSFLGWRFLKGGAPRGVHLSFMRKLRIAERALLAQSKFSGKTPVELGAALGFSATSEEHKGARPTEPGASMHTYGLAVDIKYTGNPWVREANFLAALKRSALLMSGVRITQSTPQRFLHDLGANATLTTAAIFDLLAQRNRDFRDYLALSTRPAALTAALQRRRADGTPGVFATATESDADAAQRWRTDIQKDLNNMRDPASPFLDGTNRDPVLGFLNLNRDLVIALRDTACLAWGAVDIGAGDKRGSGDMMHFDDRVCGIGKALARVGKNFLPRSGHPCVACGAPVASHEELEAFEGG